MMDIISDNLLKLVPQTATTTPPVAAPVTATATAMVTTAGTGMGAIDAPATSLPPPLPETYAQYYMKRMALPACRHH
jgi:hypothetical protein